MIFRNLFDTEKSYRDVSYKENDLTHSSLLLFYLLEHVADPHMKTTKCTHYESEHDIFTLYPDQTTVPSGSTVTKVAEIFSNLAIKELIEEDVAR